MPKAGDEDLMEESDNFSSDIDDLDDEEAIDGDDSEIEAGEEGEDDALSMVEASDNEDLISLDGEIPEGLIDFDGSDAGDEEADWGGVSADTANKKRKRDGKETKSERRKKLRALPTFASYEDYAKMIEEGPEDDV